jgi:hypothetical protein
MDLDVLLQDKSVSKSLCTDRGFASRTHVELVDFAEEDVEDLDVLELRPLSMEMSTYQLHQPLYDLRRSCGLGG